MSHKTLLGSHRAAPEGHKKGKEIAPNTRLTASIQMETIASAEEIASLIAAVKSGARAPLTPKELAAVLGGKTSHLRAINKSLRDAGLEPKTRNDAHRAHGIVPVTGTYAAFKRFSPGLKLFKFHKAGKNGDTVVGREGTLNVPSELHITGLFGLDSREVAHTNYRIHRPGKHPHTPNSIPAGATTRDLAKLQGWDLAKLDAAVRVTGYISLGGDNVKIDADLATLCKRAGINTPLTQLVSTDGTPNGSYSDDATVENTLDKLAQGLLNPNGAVVCFMAANSDDAFAGAAEAANVFKGVKIKGKLVKLSGVSISWGMGESNNTPDSLNRWGRLSQAAQLAGIDYTAATGDNGPDDNTQAATPDAPSCVPGIMGAAGIGITSDNGKTVSSIFPWNDTSTGGGETGYGISAHFAPEKFEGSLGIPVSATTGKPGHSASMFADLAQPASCASILYNKRMAQVGGTSHSAPEQIAKLTAVKVTVGVPLMLAVAEAHGAEMVDKITVGDSSDPYPATVEATYNVMTGFGSLNQDKSEAAAKTFLAKAAA